MLFTLGLYAAGSAFKSVMGLLEKGHATTSRLVEVMTDEMHPGMRCRMRSAEALRKMGKLDGYSTCARGKTTQQGEDHE